MKTHTKPSLLQKIIVVGSIFLLFGTSFFGSIQLGVEHTSTGTWYSWNIPSVGAEWEREEDEDKKDEDDDRYEKRTQVSTSTATTKTQSNDDIESIVQEVLWGDSSPTPTTTNTAPVKTVATPAQTVAPVTPVTQKAPAVVKKKVSLQANTSLPKEQPIRTVSFFFSQDGNIIPLTYNSQTHLYGTQGTEPSFESKQALIAYLFSQYPFFTEKNFGTASFEGMNQDLRKALEDAEDTVQSIVAQSTGNVYIERPFFEMAVLTKKENIAPVQTVQNEVKKVTVVPTKPKPSVAATPAKPAPVTPTPTTPKPPVTPKKDACVNGDYSGNLYDGKCGTKPKDSCPNGDFTASLYDGSCGTKPKDVCPNGDFTGNLYDGKCGTKPKDSCPNGDYTGNLYDGKCGTKPKDVCPNGDYTSSLYDGKCGVKPDTNTRAS